jgi:uncharacterized membrane protein
MAISGTPARSTAVAAYKQSQVDKYNQAMQLVDGKWDGFVSDSRISDDVKIAGAELLIELITALVSCTTVQDVKDLKGSFAAVHNLAAMPELSAVLNGASQLDAADQATLVRTLARLSAGELELKSDGAVLRPRQLGQGGQQQGNPPQQPPAAPAAPTPAQPGQPQQPPAQGGQQPPAAPAAPAPAQPSQPQQPPAQGGQQPPAAPAAPAPAQPGQPQQPPAQGGSKGRGWGLGRKVK